MKSLSNLLTALVFVSLVIFISCGSDGGGGTVDPATEQAALLQGGWSVQASNVVYNNGGPDVSWDGFALTITNATAAGGSFSTGTTTPDGFEAVWPSDGTWSFNNGNIDELLRNDGVVMEVSSVSESSLRLDFTIPQAPGRTAGIPGTWSFTFSTAN